MASISPVSAMDLDILLNIQQPMTMPTTPKIYRGINIEYDLVSKHVPKIIDSATKMKINAAKMEILYF